MNASRRRVSFSHKSNLSAFIQVDLTIEICLETIQALEAGGLWEMALQSAYHRIGVSHLVLVWGGLAIGIHLRLQGTSTPLTFSLL